jgi:hypothetical protein
MKNLLRKVCLTTGICGLALLGGGTSVLAAAEDPAGPEQRLQRLEQRLDEIVQRQQQQQGLRGQLAGPGGRGQMMGRGGYGAQMAPQQPVPPAASGNFAPAAPLAERMANMDNRFHRLAGLVKLMLVGFFVCNILLAYWIFTDIRKRGEGPGIFIALALLAGVPAAVIYSLVRIGDRASPPAK